MMSQWWNWFNNLQTRAPLNIYGTYWPEVLQSGTQQHEGSVYVLPKEKWVYILHRQNPHSSDIWVLGAECIQANGGHTRCWLFTFTICIPELAHWVAPWLHIHNPVVAISFHTDFMEIPHMHGKMRILNISNSGLAHTWNLGNRMWAKHAVLFLLAVRTMHSFEAYLKQLLLT